ncbi:MAG: hypothetical protein ACTH69_13690 [Halomonas sp.]|uniref:hypothetical protein n=1 Tax=Halomonas sp. TaxID=1486246 RepID=UPI003F938936
MNSFDENYLTADRMHPNHWHNRASDLHASAGAVWYAMEAGSNDVRQSIGKGQGFGMQVACRPVYFMLCGLSLELAFKAVITLKTPGSKLNGDHLPTLARMVGMAFTELDRQKLGFLSSAVIWAGRYPVPNKPTDEKLRSYYSLAQKVLTETADSLGNMTIRRASCALDWSDFDEIWQKVMAEFYTLKDEIMP